MNIRTNIRNALETNVPNFNVRTGHAARERERERLAQAMTGAGYALRVRNARKRVEAARKARENAWNAWSRGLGALSEVRACNERALNERVRLRKALRAR